MSNLVPLAEHMNTIQGEGMHTGVPMHFIRLTGCTVGSAASKSFAKDAGDYATPILPILANGVKGSKCRTFDGRYFDCDTDFNLNGAFTVDEILSDTYEKAICLTGGEPLIHQTKNFFWELFEKAQEKKIRIHIETSGTIEIHPELHKYNPWITVAPKYGVKHQMLSIADEIKILVDDYYVDNSDVLKSILSYAKGQVFVCSINEEKQVNMHNLDVCMKVLKEHPTWRLGVQVHKLIGAR